MEASFELSLKSVLWTLAEFYFNRGLQRPYTATLASSCKKTVNGFFVCLLFSLTLIYMGGGQICPQAVFCYSSKTVGARLLKLCVFCC